jgi:hypothetical protein
MKNKDNLKHLKACSYCYNCGWRTPLNNVPERCLLGLKDKYDMEQCRGYASCDRYIMDASLMAHIKELFK